MSHDVMTHKTDEIQLMVSPKLNTHKNGISNVDLIQDSIFWSDYAESLVTKGKLRYPFQSFLHCSDDIDKSMLKDRFSLLYSI